MMPTLKQSSAVNMAGWQPVAPATSSQPAKTAPAAPTDPRIMRDPRMLASMPLMASTGDAFYRQFYGGPNLPTFRILPVKGGSQ
jgi:hypothetical protein